MREDNLELGPFFSYLGLEYLHPILQVLRPVSHNRFLCSFGVQDKQEHSNKMSTKNCGVAVLEYVERSLIMKYRDESMNNPNL